MLGARFSFQWRTSLATAVLLSVYLIAALLIFRMIHLALPLVAPAMVFFMTLSVVLVVDYRGIRKSGEIVRSLYEQQIHKKQQELFEAEANIQQLQEQKTLFASESKQLLEEKQQDILRLEKELRDLQTSTQKIVPAVHPRYTTIIHAPNSSIVHVLQLVDKVSSDDIPVLISGETGTGKEVFARAIHESSKRPNKSFIAVNCGALPETLLESELFGHDKGAFTGATSQRKGRFELADGGTLFLDEITETTPAFQAKLLRVLQEGTFERLGSEKTIKVDVRIIAASSKNIADQVQKEQFRQDLYYRLNGFPIELPPLRERRDDIPLLAKHFLKKHGYEKIVDFSERALDVLQAYRWPGNVRELENNIRRAAILAQSDGRKIIQEIDLPAPVREITLEALQNQYQSLDEQILETLRSLKFSHSSISQTAQALGNKDRGTITEYFRGLCFVSLVREKMNIDAAARSIAATEDKAVIDKVRGKLSEYLRKVQSDAPSQTLYKGLPKKYHQDLDQIIDYINKNGNIVS
ncbi:sigma-54-dependent Fis family transcriptional regulator [candidate division KSB1 bacterium]|nr:MAG: sigma-54-dependent Fis family transcriptional regulator [candidate division KSB1 bacterium]